MKIHAVFINNGATQYGIFPTKRTWGDSYIALCPTEADAERVLSCLTACEGIESPDAAIPELVKAAKAVIANWESGDLAGAVRSLDEALGQIENNTKGN